MCEGYSPHAALKSDVFREHLFGFGGQRLVVG
jgi:hypothetical protein